MPAIITHHIFGEDASSLLPDGILTGQEELLAFLLGNQGPDPLFARTLTTPRFAKRCHQLAKSMHEGNVVPALLALRSSVSHLKKEEQSIGRAFALGMAAHYVLDCITHPLVYDQQAAIVAADPSLEEAQDKIHAILESDLDSWMLWEMRHQTILDAPASQALARTERIERVAGAMISQMSAEVYGIELGADEYGKATRDYELFYKLIDPPAKAPRALVFLEQRVHTYSRLVAQSHLVVESDTCDAANLDHRPWRYPVTNEMSVSSFPDLFHDALFAWPEFSKAFALGNEERIKAMTGSINYDGRPS